MRPGMSASRATAPHPPASRVPMPVSSVTITIRMAAAGNPMANRAAVSVFRSSEESTRRPRTVPSPHSVAAPTASSAGVRRSIVIPAGSGKARRKAPPTPATRNHPNRGRRRSPRRRDAPAIATRGWSF